MLVCAPGLGQFDGILQAFVLGLAGSNGKESLNGI
jgi:hypothetical protein